MLTVVIHITFAVFSVLQSVAAEQGLKQLAKVTWLKILGLF